MLCYVRLWHGTEAELGEGEAAGGVEGIDLGQQLLVVPLCPQLQDRACIRYEIDFRA